MALFLPSRTIQPSPEAWYRAYQRFESPPVAQRKFRQRLRQLGMDTWLRDWRIGDLGCGRGDHLQALRDHGFQRLSGLDLSPACAETARATASTCVADLRTLPWATHSHDALTAHGVLHHLPDLEADLPNVLAEVRRVLVPGGRFVAVEPWLTPFLASVHLLAFSPARRYLATLDAFATMVEHEQTTYHRWLTSPDEIRRLLLSSFRVERWRLSAGKLWFIGRT